VDIYSSLSPYLIADNLYKVKKKLSFFFANNIGAPHIELLGLTNLLSNNFCNYILNFANSVGAILWGLYTRNSFRDDIYRYLYFFFKDVTLVIPWDAYHFFNTLCAVITEIKQFDIIFLSPLKSTQFPFMVCNFIVIAKRSMWLGGYSTNLFQGLHQNPITIKAISLPESHALLPHFSLLEIPITNPISMFSN
jgi:hypothetical protein